MKIFTNKLLIIVLLAICSLAFGDEQLYRIDHCVVTYENLSLEYAKAICQTAVAARKVAIDRFGFDMPETIKISVKCGNKQKVRLFNDGKDRLYLTIRSENDLLKPSNSGIHHIYGICHEVGHLAMYRIINDHSWLTSAAAEGWAHYVGSCIVDDVHNLEKDKLWPDSYDYSSDGMKRLKSQLAKSKVSKISKGAGVWLELAGIVSDENLITILKAWSKTKINPADPAVALRRALLDTKDDVRLPEWWNKAELLFIFKQARSEFAVRTVQRKELAGKAAILANDDGQQNGKKSIAGSGHGVRFKVEGNSWYLTNIQIYGARYGRPTPPKEDFHVWICDKNFSVIADFPLPYAKFKRGNPKWVNFSIKPTNVPSEFIVCASFNPTGTKGVFVGFDAVAGENSFIALPGKKARLFDKGDWMIRARVDQVKIADSLKLQD